MKTKVIFVRWIHKIQKVEFGILGKKMTRCDFDFPPVAGCRKARNGPQVRHKTSMNIIDDEYKQLYCYSVMVIYVVICKFIGI